MNGSIHLPSPLTPLPLEEYNLSLVLCCDCNSFLHFDDLINIIGEKEAKKMKTNALRKRKKMKLNYLVAPAPVEPYKSQNKYKIIWKTENLQTGEFEVDYRGWEDIKHLREISGMNLRDQA